MEDLVLFRHRGRTRHAASALVPGGGPFRLPVFVGRNSLERRESKTQGPWCHQLFISPAENRKPDLPSDLNNGNSKHGVPGVNSEEQGAPQTEAALVPGRPPSANPRPSLQAPQGRGIEARRPSSLSRQPGVNPQPAQRFPPFALAPSSRRLALRLRGLQPSCPRLACRGLAGVNFWAN